MADEHGNDSQYSDETLLGNLLEDRRLFLKQTMAIAGLTLTPISFLNATGQAEEELPVGDEKKVQLTIQINGERRKLSVDPRTTTLDLLRENLLLTGTKKGCDFGQCGACTIFIDGRRSLACLTLAVMQHGKKITTIEGLHQGKSLHPMQEAFVKHDSFQCGYCTPGQIMSAVSCIREGCAGSEDEIRGYMSGNLCRCGAYPNIVSAIMDVKNSGQEV